ncbi:MAG: phenylalanine--tRNA ligase subunit beta [Candidatus ainarchaeum sp.]|nr:phenylalanine--tRNA ligase subunit beta [Candidatus ainarchaeum sp.]
MALTRISKKELFALLGKELSDEELSERVTSLGTPVEYVKGDEVGVEVTPNRPDMYSVEGLARALSSFLSLKRGFTDYSASESGIELEVDDSVKKVRPFIAAAAARDVKLTDELLVSLINLQEKLHDTLGRKRRKVAIGFTDLDKLKPPFRYFATCPDENAFVPLGESEPWTPGRILGELAQGKEYGYILEDHAKYPLIADSAGNAVALPPIITAEKVKLTPQARNIFIDVTGTSEHSVKDVLTIICSALFDRGAKIGSVAIKRKAGTEATPDFSPQVSSLRLRNLNRLLGREFSGEEAKTLLERMGHSVSASEKKGVLSVRTPAYRVDVLQEVDLIEDVAIPFGYNNFEPALPAFSSIGKRSGREERSDFARETMLGLGFTEVLHWYMTNRQADFEKPLAGERPAVHIRNPLTENFTMVRTWCIPSLLETIAGNKDEKTPQKIFEVGEAATIDGGKVVEETRLAAATCDPKASFSETRSCLEAAARELRLEIGFRESAHPTFIPGRAAEILVAGKSVGIIGEIHPQALNNFGIEQPVAAFEIRI